MSYFKDAKVGDKVFGLVFGLGTIKDLCDDGFYTVLVDFVDEFEVAYTPEGVPNWGKFKEQTLYYKDDIDLTEYDFTPVNKVLTPKKIIKYREKKKLEVRLPSGVWHTYTKQIKSYTQELLQDEKFHLFRKIK